MKFSAFEYACPRSVAEAVSLLSDAGHTAKPIAGGQSLLPTMAFRLAAPSLLVDLRGIPDLDRIAIGADGIRLGARVRWCDIEAHRGLADAHPLLVAAISHVAHYQIRNRGTVGGSLAHADPAAEMPGIAVACDAELTLVGSKGRRVVPADKFFLGALSTALQPDELIVEVRLPPWPPSRRWGFEEFARRRGDFAMAGVAVFFDTDAEGRATDTHVGVIGACAMPHRVRQVEAQIDGSDLSPRAIERACQVMKESVQPPEDLHGSAAYRRALAATLLERALASAISRGASRT